jgi:competence protein ComEA
MKISPLVVSLSLVAGAWAAASQNQQSAPPLKDQSAYPSATHKMTPAEKSNTPEAHGQPVDLNSGSKKDLAALPGVGPDLAQNIILARPFKTKEDLLRKKIIPQSTFDQIKDMVTVQGPKKQSVPTKSNPE